MLHFALAASTLKDSTGHVNNHVIDDNNSQVKMTKVQFWQNFIQFQSQQIAKLLVWRKATIPNNQEKWADLIIFLKRKFMKYLRRSFIKKFDYIIRFSILQRYIKEINPFWKQIQRILRRRVSKNS